MASVTALPERERERERQELGFGNSIASALGGEDLRPGGGGWSLGGPSGREDGAQPEPRQGSWGGGGPEGSYRDQGGLLQDRGSYRKIFLGNYFRGLKSCNSPGAIT